LGIGDWGLGIGDWPQSPIPNPQSPIPNPHKYYKNIHNKLKIQFIRKNKYNININYQKNKYANQNHNEFNI